MYMILETLKKCNCQRTFLKKTAETLLSRQNRFIVEESDTIVLC